MCAKLTWLLSLQKELIFPIPSVKVSSCGMHSGCTLSISNGYNKRTLVNSACERDFYQNNFGQSALGCV